MLSAWENLLAMLQSPCCQAVFHSDGDVLSCGACGHSYGVKDGILVMLPPTDDQTNDSE